MRHLLIILWLPLVFAACSNDESRTPSVPRPGLRQIPQVFILGDAQHPITAKWGFPSKDALTAALSARVEWYEAKTREEATEELQVWNGRPADLLVIGPGVPLDAWKSVKLAKVQGRKVVLVGETAPVTDDDVAVTVAEDDLKRFEKSFCAQIASSKKCQVVSGPEREALPDGTPLHLNLVVRWKSFLKDLIQDQTGRLGKSAKLDFFSGYLEARKGTALTSPQDGERFEKMKREFMLNALSKGGVQ